MSGVVIAGKVLKVIGDFLTEEEIAEWIESKTKDFLLDLAKKIGVDVAENQITERMMDISLDQLQLSEPLQVAITNSLNTIDDFIRTKVEKIKDIRSSILVISCSDVSEIIVLPRTFIANNFASKLVSEFKGSYEGSSYADLFNELLKSSALQRETAYYQELEIGESMSEFHKLVEKDSTFNWGDEAIKGHYYIENHLILGPEDPKTIDNCLTQAKNNIGRITTEQMNDLMDDFQIFAT